MKQTKNKEKHLASFNNINNTIRFVKDFMKYHKSMRIQETLNPKSGLRYEIYVIDKVVGNSE